MPIGRNAGPPPAGCKAKTAARPVPSPFTGARRFDPVPVRLHLARMESLSTTFPSRLEGLAATTTLNNGVRMPWFGLGVFKMGDDATTEACVSAALRAGYRHIDTASLYGNERGVGDAVRASEVPRDEIFITTKLWNDDMRADRQREAFEESMDKLGLETLDLYLLHWPIEGKVVESWRVLEELHRAGRIRAIGVSNFLIPHLEALLEVAEIPPVVNQIEFHPYLRSSPLLEFCRAKDIRVTAWSPFMQGGAILEDPVITKIAEAHGKSPAQVILRWDLQNGVIVIPKSSREERIESNAEVFDFTLSDAEMGAIDELDRGERSGADPHDFDF